MLQVYFNGFWYNVSGFNLDSHHLSIICKYFQFKSGTFYKQEKNRKDNSFIFSLNCSKNVVDSLSDCLIENFMEFWLDDIIASKITCFKSSRKKCINQTSDSFGRVFNFLNSCFFAYKFNKNKSFKEAEKICELNGMNLLGISSQDEARFIENLYISNYFIENTTLKNLIKLKNEWKIPTG